MTIGTEHRHVLGEIEKAENDMRKDVRVSVVQHEPKDMTQRAENVDYILANIKREAEKGSRLVVFPEAGITSFFVHEPGGMRRYWEQGAIRTDGDEIQRISEVTRTLGVYAVVGFAERADVEGIIYNSVALIGPDGIVGITRKIHLPGIEKLYFSVGPRPETFDCDLGRVGMCICYDSMFPEYFRALSDQAADIIVISSSTWKGGGKGGVGIEGVKKQYWSALPMVTAIQSQAFIVACNGCGSLDMGPLAGTWERLGLSQIVAPTGEILEMAGESEEQVISATLRYQALVDARTSYRFLDDRMVGCW